MAASKLAVTKIADRNIVFPDAPSRIKLGGRDFVPLRVAL
jgi:hypothetical protein